MRKLALDLEDLVVESFETIDGKGAAGTVLAHETFESECRCETDSCQCSVGCDTPVDNCEPIETRGTGAYAYDLAFAEAIRIAC